MISNQLRIILMATIFHIVVSLMATIPSMAETLNSNGNTDIFILNTHNATRDLSQAPVVSEFDWFNDGDKIGLTNGLTESDLDYMQLVDFDQDGLFDDAVIIIKSTQQVLGVILNADDFVLDGEFIPVSPSSTQLLTCLPKANILNCKLPTAR